MKRCAFLLGLVCATVLGQEQPAPSAPGVDPSRFQALKNALRGLHMMQIEPRVMRIEPRASVSPKVLVPIESEACVVPLLEMPVNPNIDTKMPILKGQKNMDQMPVAQDLPTCPR
jgi:hypothetical protein